MAKQIIIKSFKLADLFPLIDINRNIRMPDPMNYAVTNTSMLALADDINVGGMKVRPVLHFIGDIKSAKDITLDKFDTAVQGFRRIHAYKINADRFPNDRRWDEIECEVVYNLTEAEVIDLMIDSGNVKLLEPAEIVRAAFKNWDANPDESESNMTLKLQGMLTIHSPPSKDKLGNDEEIKKHYRGTIQCIHNAWRLPVMTQPFYYTIVEERRAFGYRKKEMATLYKVFDDERKKDATCQITRENPGPIFKEKWDAFVKEDEQARQDGNKPKSISAMSRTELQGLANNSTSLVARAFGKLTSRDGIADPDTKLQKLAAWLQRDIEPKFTDQDKANFLAIMNGDFKAAGF